MEDDIMKQYLMIGPLFKVALDFEFEWLPVEESEPFYFTWENYIHEGARCRWLALDVFRISVGVTLIKFPSAAE